MLGLNGAGKTTLLRVLVDELEPDTGTCRLGHNVSLGYYAQEHEHLVPGSAFAYVGPLGSSAEIFFSFYFAMTGMHALHMIIGLGLLTTLVVKTARGRFSVSYNTPVELVGLYWHFVDIVWIFLFPLLYLVGRHLR